MSYDFQSNQSPETKSHNKICLISTVIGFILRLKIVSNIKFSHIKNKSSKGKSWAPNNQAYLFFGGIVNQAKLMR